MKEYTYTLEMKTRDYECDVQGVVNNANYQHYLEVTRHEFLQSVGLSFQGLHDQGIDVMVSKVTISYKNSLHGGEVFLSCVNMHRAGVRYVFEHDIYRKSDMKLCVKGTVDCVCVVNGVLTRGDEIYETFAPYLDK